MQWLSRSEQMWLFAERHRGLMLAGILVAGLAAVMLATLLWLQHQREREALALESQATHAYVNRSFDDAEANTKQLETAGRLYRQILEEFPRTTSARLAWYLLGNVLAEQQDYAGAIDAYQHFLTQSETPPALLGLVYQRLGTTYLAHGEREAGYHAYTRVLQMPDALNKDQALFELAKLEEHDNRADQALVYYRRLVEQHPNSPFASEAALQVKSLEEL